MKVNGVHVTENPISNSNLNHCPYITIPGKLGAMCVSKEHVNWFINKLAKYESYLEIGTFDGVALSLYAEAYPEKRFAAVDSFETAYATGGGHYEYFFENCKKLENVSLHVGRSLNVLPFITETFDMIFIDGAHDFKSILNDYRWSWGILNKGGILVFHDIDLDDTQRVLSIVESEQNVTRQTTDVGVLYVEKK